MPVILRLTIEKKTYTQYYNPTPSAFVSSLDNPIWTYLLFLHIRLDAKLSSHQTESVEIMCVPCS
jgi:hypothetical protein